MKKAPIVDTAEEAEQLLRDGEDRLIIRAAGSLWILARNGMPWQHVPAPKWLPPNPDK